jgi:hypothetical protein
MPYKPPLDSVTDAEPVDDNLSMELHAHSKVYGNRTEVSKSTLSGILVCVA